MSEKNIQFIDLAAQQKVLGDKIDRAIKKVLDHGKYIMGPEVGELEQQLSSYCGAKHTISCASGTDALLMALMAYGVGPGDAIFVPSFTFVATAEVVSLLGATPVFVDVDPDYFLIDPNSLDEAIRKVEESDLKPRGVIPVDLFGLPVDCAALRDQVKNRDMFVLADAAQSFGAEDSGTRVGMLAEVTTTSFFPAKPLGCYGDGGAIFTNNDELAERMRSVRVHGKGGHKYDNVMIGLNGRLDTLQAAILIEKLGVFEEEIKQRNHVAGRYNDALSSSARTPALREGCISAWAQYTIQVEDRDALAEALKTRGIPSAIYYPKPLHLQTAYKDSSPRIALPVSERLSSTVLSLPMHPYLESEDQDRILSACLEALG